MKLIPGPSTVRSRPNRSTTCFSDCETIRTAFMIAMMMKIAKTMTAMPAPPITESISSIKIPVPFTPP